jgi:hypothetical protein
MASQRAPTGHLALDAVLALQEAASFRTFPDPDGEDAHRGQPLSLQQIWEHLPMKSRDVVRLESGFGNLHNISPLPLELFSKLTERNTTEPSPPLHSVSQEPLDRLLAAEDFLLKCHAADYNACSTGALRHACLRTRVYGHVPVVHR